jgi:hypothetical protein
MAITREMVLLRMEDIAPYAEARALVSTVKSLLETARRDANRRALAELHVAAVAVTAAIAEALRAGDARDEVRRLRDAAFALAELRIRAWEALGSGAIGTARFDDVMARTARCRLEVERLESEARRRGRERIDGVA